jgi:SpoVK/Ycf46/Vps4 family AAA+-type ATPase
LKCLSKYCYLRELDPAIFRRLEKRIFIDLPDVQARKDMFEYYLSEMLQKNKYIKCKIDSDSLAQVSIYYKQVRLLL